MTQTTLRTELQKNRVFASVVDWVLSESQSTLDTIPGSATDVPILKLAHERSTVLKNLYS